MILTRVITMCQNGVEGESFSFWMYKLCRLAIRIFKSRMHPSPGMQWGTDRVVCDDGCDTNVSSSAIHGGDNFTSDIMLYGTNGNYASFTV